MGAIYTPSFLPYGPRNDQSPHLSPSTPSLILFEHINL